MILVICTFNVLPSRFCLLFMTMGLYAKLRPIHVSLILPFSSISIFPFQFFHSRFFSNDNCLASFAAVLLLCLISSGGILFSVMFAANVLGRAKNLDTLVMSGLISLSICRVFSNACLVSPGNPTMMSVAIVKFGNVVLNVVSNFLYSLVVYCLCIFLSIWSSPL